MAFLRSVRGDRLYAAFLLSILGLRRGEVCGLRWSDVDLTGELAEARKLPKGTPSVAVPDDVLVLTEESMWDGPGAGLVRQVLVNSGGHRVVELREYGVDYLLDVELFRPRYAGAERVWSDHTLDWIADASHEGTIAFGGTLTSALRATWRDLDSFRWSGW